MLRKFFAFLIVLFFSLQLACAADKNVVFLHVAGKDGHRTPEIKAELATKHGERALGLMYRRELGETQGMLFIFPDEKERSFWMKNTYLDLDMVFFDRNLKVVSFIEHAVPLSESPRLSAGPAQYVLEIRGGSAAKWGIKAGDSLVVKGEIPKGE